MESTLARIDRRVFAELAHTDGRHLVKVPVSNAVWSTWRRYCEVIGLSMGEGVAFLILSELRTSNDAANAEPLEAARHASRPIKSVPRRSMLKHCRSKR